MGQRIARAGLGLSAELRGALEGEQLPRGIQEQGEWDPWIAFETPVSARLLLLLIGWAKTAPDPDLNVQTSDLVTLMGSGGEPTVQPDIERAMESVVQAGYAVSTSAGGYQLLRMPLIFIGDVLRMAFKPIDESGRDVLVRLATVLVDPETRPILEQVASGEPTPMGQFPPTAAATLERLQGCQLIEVVADPHAAHALTIPDKRRSTVRALLHLVPPEQWQLVFPNIRSGALVALTLLLGRRNPQAISDQFTENQRRLWDPFAHLHGASSTSPLALPVEAIPDDLLDPANEVELMQRLGRLALTVPQLHRAATDGATEAAIKYALDGLMDGGLVLPNKTGSGSTAYLLTPLGARLGRALEELVMGTQRLARDRLLVTLLRLGSQQHMDALAAIHADANDATVAKNVVGDLIDCGLVDPPPELWIRRAGANAKVSRAGRTILLAHQAYGDFQEWIGPDRSPRWLRGFLAAEWTTLLESLTAVLGRVEPSEAQIDARIHQFLTDNHFGSLILGLGQHQARGIPEVQLVGDAVDLAPILAAAGVNIRVGDGVFASLPVMPSGRGKIGDLLSLVFPGTLGQQKNLADALAGFTPELVAILRYQSNCDGQVEGVLRGFRGRTWPREGAELDGVRTFAQWYVTTDGERPEGPRNLVEDMRDHLAWHAKSTVAIAAGTGLSEASVHKHLANAQALGLGKFQNGGDTEGGRRFMFEPWVMFLRAAVEQLAVNAVKLTRPHIAKAVLQHLSDVTDAGLITDILRGSFSPRPVTPATLAATGLHRTATGEVLSEEIILEHLRAMCCAGVVKFSVVKLSSGGPELAVSVSPEIREALEIGRRLFREQQLSEHVPGVE